VKYKQYPGYKDSGVEWLGKVPEEWVVRKLKFISTANDEVISDSAPQDGIINYIDIGSVSTGSIDDAVELLLSDAPSRARRVIKDGDILVSTVRTYLKAIAPVTRKYDGCIASTGFSVIRTGKGFDSGFAKYALLSSYFVDLVESRSVGISYPAINTSDLLQFKTLLPSPQEQKSISNYLDKATAKIDTLIEKQTKLIELLKEKRQAVISSAVTRGLDASVPMKDSGVEWLGEIPEHWGAKRLKFIIKKIESGTSVNAANVPANSGEYGVLKTSSVYSGDFRYTENKTVVENEMDRVSCPLKTNTIIVSRMNTPDLVGSAGYVHTAPSNIFLPDRLWQISFNASSAKFIHYVTLTNTYRGYIHTVCAGTSSSMQNLSQDDFREFTIALPKKDEQKLIYEYLDIATNKIDNLITKSTQAITLLKEKRTALISAAVTGKIDVRDAA